MLSPLENSDKHMRRLKQYVILIHKQLLKSSYSYTEIDNRNYNHCPSFTFAKCLRKEFTSIKRHKGQRESMHVEEIQAKLML